MRLAALASSILVGVPVIINVVADLRAGRWDDQLARLRPPRPDPAKARVTARDLGRVHGPTIEQLAADLRRLRTTVSGGAHRSATRQLGAQLAYDTALAQACEMLGIAHDLGQESAGLDRDVERVRVEAELEGAGMVLSTDPSGRNA